MGDLDRDDVAGAQAREIASLRAEVEALRKRVEKAERAHAETVAVLREVMDAEAWDDPGTKTHETVRSWLDDRVLVARADAVLAGRAWNDDGEVT